MLTCTISYHGKTNAERSIGRTFYLHIFLLAMDTIEIRIECDYSRAVFVDGRCQISRHRDRIFSCIGFVTRRLSHTGCTGISL